MSRCQRWPPTVIRSRGVVAILATLAVLLGSMASTVATAAPAAASTTIELEQTGQAASVGGSGGSAFNPVYCPNSYIAVGIRGAQSPHSFGSGGHWITEIGLVCQKIDFAARGLTATGYSTVITGGGNTASQESILCPTGQVLVGLQMTADTSLGYSVLKTAEPQCQSVSFGDPSAPTAPLLAGAIFDRNDSFGSQYGSGLPTASCSSGQFILGFGGRVGAALDLFTPYCGRFKTAAPTVTSPATVSTASPSLLAPLSVTAGFSGGPTPVVTYQWYRCDSSGAGGSVVPGGCTAFTGATSSSYTPGPDDAGKYLRGAAVATNGYGTLTSVSSAAGPTSVPTPTLDLPAGMDTGLSSTDNLTSVAAPVIQLGGLVVGATVSVEATDGSTTVQCEPFEAASSSDTCTLPALSPDGAWTVSVTQVVSSVASTAATMVVTVDTSGPSAPSSIALATSSDTGVSADLVTNDTTPTIDLTGLEVGARVIVTASKPGSSDVTCVISNATGASESCTFSTPLASDGQWTFSAVQVDDAGNESMASTPISATLDTSAGVALTSVPVASGLSATAATTFLFTATLTDAPAGATAFAPSDITIAGTSTGWSVDPASWTQVSPTEYTFVVSATTPTQGTLVVKVPAGSYDDTAGNSATASAGPDWTSTVVVEPPVSTAAPVVTALTGSTTTLGSTLSSSPGVWNDKGDISPVTSYQWQICDDAVGTNCIDASGATGSTYVPMASSEGKYVRSVVTRTNVKGETEQASNIVGPMTKSPQDIDFTNPGTKTYSPTPFTVAPRSEFPGSANLTGLTVQVTSLTPDVCMGSGTSVTMLKAGTCTLVADQPGNAEFDPATRVTHSFTINRANDSSTTTPSASQVEPGDTFTLSTSNLTSGVDTYTTVSGPCTVSGNVVTATSGTGDCVIATVSAQDERYNASSAPNITVRIRDIDAIALPTIDDTMVSASSFTVSGVSISGRTPSLSAGPAGVCSYAAGRVVPTGPGTCTITATLADDGSWSAATATTSFDLIAPPSAPTIASVKTAAADGVLGGTAQVYFTPGPMNGSELVDYTLTASPVAGGTPLTVTCSVSPCAIPGLAGAGYDVAVTTNARALGAFVSATSAPMRATVLAPHPIVFVSPGSKRVGSAAFAVAPTSSVDGSWIPTVTSTTPQVCQVSGMSVTVRSAGTCTLVAEHPGGVHAAVAYGLGSQTVSFAVVSPASTVAGPPTGVSAVINGDKVTVAWMPPASSGSFPVTTYQVIGSTGQTCISSTPSCTFPAPSPGQGVTFMVRALTGAGWSAWSAPATAATGPGNPTDPSEPGGPDEPTDPPGPDGGSVKAPPPPTTVTIDRDGGRTAIVTIELPAPKPQRPIEIVIIAVTGANGEVLRRITIEVEAGQRILTERVPIPPGATVRVYTTNRAGVSNRAPAGANVLEQKTIVGKRPDGRPILYGKKIAKPVFFGPDSPELDGRAKGILREVARYVGRNGGTVMITGFVRKDVGPRSFDEELSSARALQVANYLSSLGVDTWIRYGGGGRYREIDPQASDRRVEIRWAKDGIPGSDPGNV